MVAAALAERGIGLVISIHDEEQRHPVACEVWPPPSGTAAGDFAPRPEKVEWLKLECADWADTDLLQHFDTVADTLKAFFARTVRPSLPPPRPHLATYAADLRCVLGCCRVCEALGLEQLIEDPR